MEVEGVSATAAPQTVVMLIKTRRWSNHRSLIIGKSSTEKQGKH